MCEFFNNGKCKLYILKSNCNCSYNLAEMKECEDYKKGEEI